MAEARTIRIFLASSSELVEDRKEFEIFINRKNKLLNKENIFIELNIWEDFLDAMSQTRLQDEYNRMIKECDIFVMLFFTKVGKYTREEFETAFGQFKATSKPLIYTYFKDAPINTGDLKRSDQTSLWDFQDKLSELGHFWTKYQNIDSLKYQFSEQLEKLRADGFAKLGWAPYSRADMIRETAAGSLEIPERASFGPASFYLPPAPEFFIGRDALLEELHQRLQADQPLLLVNGMGGIGKTSVAQAYLNCRKFAETYDRIAWVSVTGELRQDFTSVIAGLLKISFAPNDTIEKQFMTVITEMRNIPGNHLLIIDNANNYQELIAEKDHLRATGWKILITTRCHPEDYHSLSIDELPEPDAIRLFQHHYRGEVEPGVLHDILTHIHRHTLLTELLAKAGRIKGMTPAQILERLRQAEGIKDSDLQRMINIGSHSATKDREKTAALYKYILSIFEPEKMAERYQRILRVFAILPADDIPLVHLKRIFAVAAEAENQFEDDLEALFQEGWLNQKRERTAQRINISYKMHALVQDVVFEKLQPDEENCDFVIRSLSTIMEAHLTISYDYIVYAQDVTLKIASSTSQSGLLNLYLSDTYKSIGKLELAITVAELAGSAFNICKDKVKLGATYSRLGELHQALGRFDQALQFFELAKNLIKELYETNPTSEELKNYLAISYSFLGDLYQSLGYSDQARQFFELGNDLFKELYKGNPKNLGLKKLLATSYERLGVTHQELGRFNQALGFFNLEFHLLKELFEADPKNETLIHDLAIFYERAGAILETLGHSDQALQFFELATKLFKKLYEDNPKNEILKTCLAISYSKLSKIHQTLGRFDQALQFCELELNLIKELYEANPRIVDLKYGLAVTYTKLAGIYKNDNKKEAKKLYQMAQRLYEELFEVTKLKRYQEDIEKCKQELLRLEG